MLLYKTDLYNRKYSTKAATNKPNNIECGVGALCRSRMAIIPQDIFLFSGTIRENLDPCGRHLDQQLLDVLDQCHLSAVVSRMGERQRHVGGKW